MPTHSMTSSLWSAKGERLIFNSKRSICSNGRTTFGTYSPVRHRTHTHTHCTQTHTESAHCDDVHLHPVTRLTSEQVGCVCRCVLTAAGASNLRTNFCLPDSLPNQRAHANAIARTICRPLNFLVMPHIHGSALRPSCVIGQPMASCIKILDSRSG